MRFLRQLACVSALLCPSLVMGAGLVGEAAPDFPPGAFSDGGHYDLADFKGKAVVVFFFESECPTCKGLVPQWNRIVAQYKDKPVKFLAVGPHNSLAGVRAYVGETRLAMPVFADNLNIMEGMYGQTISMQNVRQFRLIGPDGKVVAYEMSPTELDKALADVSWKYMDKGYDPRLNKIITLLEWNQYEPAMKPLRALVKSSSPSLAASAAKLYAAVKSEGEQWKSDADAAAARLCLKTLDAHDGSEWLWPLGATAKAGSVDPLSRGNDADEAILCRLRWAGFDPPASLSPLDGSTEPDFGTTPRSRIEYGPS